jgi:5-methylcytosine-specific restriction endonuclease McrA
MSKKLRSGVTGALVAQVVPPWNEKAMTDTYIAIHEATRKILLFTHDYLANNSDGTKALLLRHGTCPDCCAAVNQFTACECMREPERWPDQWAVSIANNDWPIVQAALEKDRLRIKSKRSAEVRQHKFKYCAGIHTSDDVSDIRAIQGDTCYFCKTPLAGTRIQIDHLTSVTAGGAEWPTNLAITCEPCNKSKGSMSEREFWVIQKRKLGLAATDLRAQRSAQRKLKEKLDQVRVKEVKECIARFEQSLNSAIDSSLGIEVELEFDDDGIAFRLENMTLFSLPCSHRQVAAWSQADAESWATPLVALHRLMGQK